MREALGHGEVRRASLSREPSEVKERSARLNWGSPRTLGTSSSVAFEVDAPALAPPVPLARPAAVPQQALTLVEDPRLAPCGSAVRRTFLTTSPDAGAVVAGRFCGTVEEEELGVEAVEAGGRWVEDEALGVWDEKRQFESLQVLQSGHRPNRRCVGNMARAEIMTR